MPIDVDPVIGGVGPFMLTWHGLFIGIGLVTAMILAWRHLRADGFDPDLAYDGVIWIILPGLAGARLFHVVDSWSYYAVHPLDLFTIYRGGASAYGAIIFGTIGALLFARRRRLPIARFFDALAPAQALGLSIGRVGDLLTGADLGRPTNLPFAVTSLNPASPDTGHLMVNAVAAYQMALGLGILLVLLVLRRRVIPGGVAFWTFTGLYALGQIWTGFVRVEPPDALGFGQAQLVGGILLLLSVVALLVVAGRALLVHHAAGSPGTSTTPRRDPETLFDRPDQDSPGSQLVLPDLPPRASES